MHFSCSAPFSLSEVTTTRFSWNSTNLPRWGETEELQPPKLLPWWNLYANWCFVKASFLIYEVRVVWMSNFFPASCNTPFEVLWSGGQSFSMPVPFHQRCLGAKISVSLRFIMFHSISSLDSFKHLFFCLPPPNWICLIFFPRFEAARF